MAADNLHGSNGRLSGERIADKLHHAVDQATDRASDMASHARTNIDTWVRDLGTMMQRRPIATIAIGVACGYLLARLRRRG